MRAWAETQPDQKVEIFRLALPDLPSSRHAAKYTAYEDNLYALTMPVVAGMEQQAVEKHLLRRVDDLAAGVLRQLTTTGLAWPDVGRSLRLGALPDVAPTAPTAIVQELRTESSKHLEASLIDQPEEYDAIAGIDAPSTLLE